MFDALFKPFQCKSLNLPNRLVMAPMTRSHSPNGILGPDMAPYYARRAAANVGLIISEATGIARPGSLNDLDVPRFYGEAELAAWKTAVDAVHASGGQFVPQLWHVGAMRAAAHARRVDDALLESPSGLDAKGQLRNKPMTDSDIADTIAAYADAAANAKKMGCDGVEIHGAHGYLIDQFFWPLSNRREDQWGGNTLLERSRFAVEILKAVRASVGEDFAVILRVSQWKQQDYEARLAETPQELDAWLNLLSDAGVDIFHLSQRRFWEAEFAGSELNLAGWAKKLTGKPTITVGSVGLNGDFLSSFSGGGADQAANLDQLATRLEKGEFDLVAVGRALLQDPAWATKLKESRSDEMSSFNAASMLTVF
ncbi:NADH:flavin oxidoreductase [Spongiibacter sp. KMU-158]|uniref:NADH:flavin oxidoreductase n=1 Tax=Spongiibacter pelagi TaxID=2760804 RepID=A0A927BYL1_9GAMM|nr:NADH:flavin oxidoreductase [Spongiibacter pelagi]